MVRRLEKIEKEMGYCDVKIEKERRLRQQVAHLQAEIDALQRFMQIYAGSVVGLQNLPFAKMAQQIAVEKARMDKVGQLFGRAKEDFISAGVLELVREERDMLLREREVLAGKLASFAGFGVKRENLEAERSLAMRSLAPSHSSKMRKLGAEFARVEELWSSLTEDALNMDEGIFYLARNVDYIQSAKAFLITAKGSFDIEGWMDGGFQSDLFRHSNIGRAKEMIDGANRNLKQAQKELCCLRNVRIRLEGFEPQLVAFLDGLFDDIFFDGRLGRSIAALERSLIVSEKDLATVRQKRESLHVKLERTERLRSQLFQRLSGEKSGRVSAAT